jgi:hypothetical protein
MQSPVSIPVNSITALLTYVALYKITQTCVTLVTLPTRLLLSLFLFLLLPFMLLFPFLFPYTAYFSLYVLILSPLPLLTCLYFLSSRFCPNFHTFSVSFTPFSTFLSLQPCICSSPSYSPIYLWTVIQHFLPCTYLPNASRLVSLPGMPKIKRIYNKKKIPYQILFNRFNLENQNNWS